MFRNVCPSACRPGRTRGEGMADVDVKRRARERFPSWTARSVIEVGREGKGRRMMSHPFVQWGHGMS